MFAFTLLHIVEDTLQLGVHECTLVSLFPLLWLISHIMSYCPPSANSHQILSFVDVDLWMGKWTHQYFYIWKNDVWPIWFWSLFWLQKRLLERLSQQFIWKNFYNYFLTRLQKRSLSSCQSESFWSLCFECQVYYELAKFTENFANIKPTSKTSKSLVKLFTMTSRARIPKTVHFSQKSCKAGGSDTTYL